MRWLIDRDSRHASGDTLESVYISHPHFLVFGREMEMLSHGRKVGVGFS